MIHRLLHGEGASLNVQYGDMMVMSPMSSSASGHSGMIGDRATASMELWNHWLLLLVVASKERGRGWPRWHTFTSTRQLTMFNHPATLMSDVVHREGWPYQTKPTRVTTGCRSVRSLARSSLVYDRVFTYLFLNLHSPYCITASRSVNGLRAMTNHKGHFLKMIMMMMNTLSTLLSCAHYPFTTRLPN